MSECAVNQTGRVLITGVTGFIGHHVLAEMLSHGVACAALIRPGADRRLGVLLDALGVNYDQSLRSGRLLLMEGDLNASLPRAIGTRIDSVLHIAACTEFENKPNGDPWRTNVLGTRKLLEWAEQRGVKNLHLVSSAYRCGLTSDSIPERIDTDPPVFNNDYEHSKWQSEFDARNWAQRHGATLTVYRPSVVVGHSATSCTTNYGGFYVMARATQVLAQRLDGDVKRRHATGIRVVGRPSARQNLVPVDYVAKMIATAVTDPRHHGKVYHLTHPVPPNNARIKAAIDGYFGVGGSDFIDPDQLNDSELSDIERLFYDVSKPVRSYMTHTPAFERRNATVLEAEAGVRCPEYTQDRLQDLIRYADEARWGRDSKPRDLGTSIRLSPHDDMIRVYFERYLPARVAESDVAQRTAMTVTVRFVIEDVPGGAWRCRFVAGQLVHCQRAGSDSRPDHRDSFVYVTSRDVFWQAVAGNVDPQRVFLEDRARVVGDVESALKMAMVLYQFNREFPCTPASLAKWESTREEYVCGMRPREVVV